MKTNFVHNNVNDALPVLLTHLLADGDEVGSRLGERTMELSAVGITLEKPWQRELVLPGRKASVVAQIAETMWVLAGRKDIGWLSHYLPRAVDFSDDGKTWRAGYGPRLRDYGAVTARGAGVDQLDYIVETLRSSPGSRQAVATIWDPVIDQHPGKDRACNNWLHFLARKGKLDLLVGIRSNDVMWGWSGINAFEWSALLEIVAGMIGHEVGSLHFAVGSFHLYDRHWAKAQELATQSDTWLDDSPRFNATGLDDIESLDYLLAEWFRAEEIIRSGQPYDVELFPEPMLQSWLRVLAWWWSGGNHEHLVPLRNTRLYEACKAGVQPKSGAVGPEGRILEPVDQVPEQGFVDFVHELHSAKHAAYGDSWKRRGEYMIMANIARKIDRLEGGADTPDETQTDTAIDLLVYLCKYDAWLAGLPGGPQDVHNRLLALEGWHETTGHTASEKQLVDDFSTLEKLEASSEKFVLLGAMMEQAYCLAYSRWAL